MRILAHFLYTHGYARRPDFTVETPGGVVRISVHAEGPWVREVSVEMGRVSFRAAEVPVAGPDREVVDEPLDVDGETVRVTALTIGNPHCVVVLQHLDRERLFQLGPRLERHPAFPRRTNVQLAQVLAPDRVRALIWERGAGHTLASGSSSCAVAAACHRLGLTGPRVTVEMEGGELSVAIAPDGMITLTGPVEEICRGTLSPDLLRHLEHR